MHLPQPSAAPARPMRTPAALTARIDTALLALRVHGRRAVRIIDLGCGPGMRLLDAVLRARALGFTAIEGYGIDARWPASAAPILVDPAIGLSFATGSPLAVLAGESNSSCDLLLCDAALLVALPPEARAETEAALRRVTGSGAILLD